MPKKYPPLTPAEVRDILRRLGFEHRRTGGSHELWAHPNLNGSRRGVTVDAAVDVFDDALIKSMIDQAGVTREAFYGATRTIAAKINVKWRR